MDAEYFQNYFILDSRSILNRVDEYTLYCYYTGIPNLIPNRSYKAQYRKDTCPSFTFFASTRGYVEYMWKDQATGLSGNIFDLIALIEGLGSRAEAYARVNQDFDLGFDTPDPVRREKIVVYNRPPDTKIKISIVEQPLSQKGIEYWNQFRVSKQLLERYKTSQVKYYWSYVGQQAPTTASDPTFSYRIGEYYQLYSPYNDKQFKFRNDLPEGYFFGYIQLPTTGDVLVIDKSCKDVIYCARLGYNAVCGKSETTMIPEKKMLDLHQRFKTIYLTLDNDKAGRDMTEKYVGMYPWLQPRFLIEAKDKTDLCIKLGFDSAKSIIDHTLSNNYSLVN